MPNEKAGWIERQAMIERAMKNWGTKRRHVRLHRKTYVPRLHSVIKLSILTRIAVKNLLSKKLRTFLTMTGIIIGVGAVVFLVSLAIGLHGVVNQQVLGSKSVNTIDVTTPNATNILLNDAAVNKIDNFAHVTKVAPAYIVPGQITYQNSQTAIVVYGTNNEYITLSALKFVAGSRQLTGASSTIVNTSLLNLIGESNPRTALHKKLVVETTVTTASGGQKDIISSLTVSGIINTGSGAEIYMSSQPFTNNEVAQYGQVKVETDARVNVATVRKQIAGLGLTTASPLDTLDQINTIFTIFTFVVAGFGGIGMVIAVLGMFNTLTISLLERTSELGLMITLGARKADIQRLLMFESLLLSVSGGILGLFFAWLVGLGINFGLTRLASGNGVSGTINAFSVSPLLVLITLALTVLIGVAVAYYPSRRAARINPIDALKHE
jgi:putative ABC transport system permease protein